MVTKTVFFIQHQVESATFSDAETNLEKIENLDAAFEAFKKAHGHRRLLALSTDLFTGVPQGVAVELSRV